MDPRILNYYNTELQHLRDMGGEFAKLYPKIAARLGLDEFDCADPYVERLLEGFAFLAARVRVKMDAQFPEFTQHLLEIVYPHYLTPIPSMLVAKFEPDLNEGSLGAGYVIDKNTAIRSLIGKGDNTACEYRTAHRLCLWPIQIREINYFETGQPVSNCCNKNINAAKSGLQIKLNTTAGLKFNQLQGLDSLVFYIRGNDGLQSFLNEQLLAHSFLMAIQFPGFQIFHEGNPFHTVGFNNDQALLPYTQQSFSGYRLLQEYFAFPERYCFVELCGLQEAFSECNGNQLEIIIAFDYKHPHIAEDSINSTNMELNCTPAINLFPKRTDRIHLNEHERQHHIVPDRNNPMDYEVHSVTEVLGLGSGTDQEQFFYPFYDSGNFYGHREEMAFYSLLREPRMISSKRQRQGPRSSYTGSEVFISLVDARNAPYNRSLKQLAVKTLCSNRDLPLFMPVGKTNTDFTLQEGAPVNAIKCLAGPTRPRPSNAQGQEAWKMISHLSLNYLSLLNTDSEHGAVALRDLLSLYSNDSDLSMQKQIEGVLSINTKSVLRRIEGPGPITFGRGLEIGVEFDESLFEGSGVFVLGLVLEQFFAKYTSLNSFTETVIKTTERGELHRWTLRQGTRPLI